MNGSLPTGYEDNFIWWPELGMGYHPAEPIDYDGDYWDKYLEYDKSDMGKYLTRARVNLVKEHTKTADIVDIGIGGGLFVSEINCYGFDVNKRANNWLHATNRFKNPYEDRVHAITCWDSIEHIPDPTALLNNVDKWFFASIPLFKSGDTVQESKHYRPGEHIWYFTHNGFIEWAKRHGFELVEWNDQETLLGREDIRSYAFRRFPLP
jgi:hypothetical protein